MQHHDTQPPDRFRESYPTTEAWLDASERLINTWGRGQVLNAWSIGDQLNRIKADYLHKRNGEGFTAYMKRFEWLNERTAYRWMGLAEQFTFDTVSKVIENGTSMSALYALASPSVDEDTREALIEQAAQGERVTAEQVRAAVTRYPDHQHECTCGNQIACRFDLGPCREGEIGNCPQCPSKTASLSANAPEQVQVTTECSCGDLPEEAVMSGGVDVDCPTHGDTGEVPLAKVIDQPARWIWPDYWPQIMALEGYKNKDYTGTVKLIETTCENRGVETWDVVEGFCQDWPEIRLRYSHTDPVATLRNERVLSVQISKVKQAQGKVDSGICPTCKRPWSSRVTFDSVDGEDKYAAQEQIMKERQGE